MVKMTAGIQQLRVPCCRPAHLRSTLIPISQIWAQLRVQPMSEKSTHTSLARPAIWDNV